MGGLGRGLTGPSSPDPFKPVQAKSRKARGKEGTMDGSSTVLCCTSAKLSASGHRELPLPDRAATN